MNQALDEQTLDVLRKMFLYGKKGIFEYLASSGWEHSDIESCWFTGRCQLHNIAQKNIEEAFETIKMQMDLIFEYGIGEKNIDAEAAETIILNRLLDVFPYDMAIAQKMLDRFEAHRGIHGNRHRITERALASRKKMEEREEKEEEKKPMIQTRDRGVRPVMRRVYPTENVLCPKCGKEKVIRPMETKVFRCKKSDGGCGYESVYPIPHVTLKRV